MPVAFILVQYIDYICSKSRFYLYFLALGLEFRMSLLMKRGQVILNQSNSNLRSELI